MNSKVKYHRRPIELVSGLIHDYISEGKELPKILFLIIL